MKITFTFLLGLSFTFLSINTDAQSVYRVKFESEANVKVLLVPDSLSADLVVYQVSSAGLAGTNNGVWYIAGFPDAVTKNIFFVSNVSDADIKVFYTSNQSAAGWINTSKQSLLN